MHAGQGQSMVRPQTLVVLTAGLALTVGGCGGSDDTSSASPETLAATETSATPSPPTSTRSAPPSPSATPTSPPARRSKGRVVLGGEDLGVTRLGEPFRKAVAAVTAALGKPDADPAKTVSCIAAETEVRWGELVLAAQDDRLAGWASRSTTLQTPSGVTIGTPLTDLERIYGSSLERFPANPDNPPTFSVEGVDVIGSLSSASDDAHVTRLFTSFCSGP